MKAEALGKVGKVYGIVCEPGRTSIVQISARAKRHSKGRGSVFVEGDIGEDCLKSVATVCQLLGECKEFDLAAMNVLLSIPCAMDGDSAGVAIFLAIYSSITKKPINQTLAFTGALSPVGATLPVGFIEDKLIAAYRAKLEGVVLPMDNLHELALGETDDRWPGMVLCPALRIMDVLVLATP